jgi:DNA polymerase-3 subunit gamma/tau
VWSDVLDAVRVRKRTTHALLLNAQVTTVEERDMAVSFNTAPLARQFSQGVNVDLLREALLEILGVDWSITITVGGAADDQATAPAGVPRPAGQPTRPADFAAGDEPTDHEEPEQTSGRQSGEDAAVALLKSGLGAQVIGEVEA